MKKLILLFCVFCIGNVFSQYIEHAVIKLDKFNALENANLKFTYQFAHIQDVANPDATIKRDIHNLLIGKNVSKYFSQKMVSTCLDNSAFFVENGVCGFEIYKNYPVNKMTVTDLGTVLGFNKGESFIYEEEMPQMKWEIKSDTSTILSYHCQKAITAFRGRKYEAWFTSDIPSNNGPWKFGGLPGLILKVTDTKHEVVFECIGIEKLQTPEPIKFYTLNYNKTNYKDLNKLYKHFLDDVFDYMAKYTMAGNVTGMAHAPKKPFNPIELE
jgi:GLPGLI family protein